MEDRNLYPERGRLMPTDRVFLMHEVDRDKVALFVRVFRHNYPPPVRVVRYPGAFMVVDGHHRIVAAQLLGEPVPALIVDGEAFEDLDRELEGREGNLRADDLQFWKED